MPPTVKLSVRPRLSGWCRLTDDWGNAYDRGSAELSALKRYPDADWRVFGIASLSLPPSPHPLLSPIPSTSPPTSCRSFSPIIPSNPIPQLSSSLPLTMLTSPSTPDGLNTRQSPPPQPDASNASATTMSVPEDRARALRQQALIEISSPVRTAVPPVQHHLYYDTDGRDSVIFLVCLFDSKVTMS